VRDNDATPAAEAAAFALPVPATQTSPVNVSVAKPQMPQLK
jgi:hypothetical protein